MVPWSRWKVVIGWALCVAEEGISLPWRPGSTGKGLRSQPCWVLPRWISSDHHPFLHHYPLSLLRKVPVPHRINIKLISLFWSIFCFGGHSYTYRRGKEGGFHWCHSLEGWSPPRRLLGSPGKQEALRAGVPQIHMQTPLQCVDSERGPSGSH